MAPVQGHHVESLPWPWEEDNLKSSSQLNTSTTIIKVKKSSNSDIVVFLCTAHAGEIHIQAHHRTVVCTRSQSKYSWLVCLRIIYNGPSSRPHQIAFYDMQGEGCRLLPRSSMGTLLLYLRPEAGYTLPLSGVRLAWKKS